MSRCSLASPIPKSSPNVLDMVIRENIPKMTETKSDNSNGSGMSSSAPIGIKAKKEMHTSLPLRLKPKEETPANSTTSAKQAALDISKRIGKSGPSQDPEPKPLHNRGPDAGAFHSVMVINDFPQKARWAVTNRNKVTKILESTAVSVTSKGQFYPPGKGPESRSDPPKLYLLIEGDDEIDVWRAAKELQTLLKEGIIAEAQSESRSGTTGGRYSVV